MAPPGVSHQIIAAALAVEIGLAVGPNPPRLLGAQPGRACSARDAAPRPFRDRHNGDLRAAVEQLPGRPRRTAEQIGATVYRRDAEGWNETAVGAGERLRLDAVGLDIALGDLDCGVPGLSV